MAAKQLKGVGGVLGNLLSDSKPDATNDQPATSEAETQQPESPPQTTQQETKAKARLGRPPAEGRSSEPVEREKVSLRLRADLAAAYRAWSWDERCQFSDLVDRALESYLKSRKKSQNARKE